MIILGIETSCDETAAAVVENGTKILSSVIASSEELHQKTGGIIPEVAAREQLKCILPVIQESIKSSKSIKGIDAIAVTVGPGLIGSLLVGVETARTLAWLWQKPIIPVNHLKAHLYANFLNQLPNPYCLIPKFPAIGLVVSGGHTDLVLMKNHDQIKWLGGTRDDAAGECFDKCARLLDLGYPGGPAIEASASKFKVKSSPASPSACRGRAKLKVKLPRPMINQDNFDFSFSGLKTAVLNICRGGVSPPIPQLAHEIQEAITDVLVAKTIHAAKKFKVKSILIGGGVAANTSLRSKLKVKSAKLKVKFFAPPKNLCTDNAAIIASRAYFHYHPVPFLKIKPNPGLTIY